MEYKVTAPVRTYNGLSAGVPFTQGVGYTDNEEVMKWFKSKGYKIETESVEVEEPEIKGEEIEEPEIKVEEVEEVLEEDEVDDNTKSTKPRKVKRTKR